MTSRFPVSARFWKKYSIIIFNIFGLASCNSEEYQCRRSATCIPREKRCDRKADCKLNEDELDCRKLKKNLPFLDLGNPCINNKRK